MGAKQFLRIFIPGLLAVLLGPVQTMAAPGPTTPTAEDFGALPFLSQPVLAPNGQRLAARGLVNDRPRLLIVDIANDKATKSAVDIAEGNELEWYRWAGNNVLLVGVSGKITVLKQEIRSTEIIAYDLVSGKSRAIDVGRGLGGDDLIYVDPAGAFILVAAQVSWFDFPSVFRVDLATDNRVLVVPAQANVWSWFADETGVVRTGIGGDKDNWWIYYRHDDKSAFRKSAARPYRGDNQPDRLAVLPGSDRGFAMASGASGRFGLYRYDFAADALGELIYENPTVDIDDFDLGATGQLESISYTDDRARTLWFDTAFKALQAKLEKALPKMSVRIVSMSVDRSRIAILATSATNPGTYYLLDRTTSRMMVIAAPFDRLADKQLAEMESVSYKARDGLDIPGYLTLPPGREPKDLPLVIMPHGGPYARDEWGYDVWAQFLATRGYVVLQPNFRGSTGYGRQFVAKGDGQWGRGMQDDIDDGVKWLVARGIVDAKRVCIMGASFGGYAAEWAAVRNPEIYRCAISLAGVSDIGAQLKYDRKSFSAPRYFRNWRDRVQGKDGTSLDSISPLKRVAALNIPILIAHGDADTNVPLIQSQKLAAALTRLGRPLQYIVYKGEGHGFTKPENQVDFLKRVEAFLTKYNPPEPSVQSGPKTCAVR